ncbi:MAG: hypothetical protein SO170_10585 [Butyribacter sp.]|nr:hypothetical protein [bacterium]MDY3855382.1 hypothetical protein [Butyribacter sp.]
MKIGEARAAYNFQLKEYHSKQLELAKQKEKLEEKIKNTENGVVIYKNEAAQLELSYNAVSEKYEEYHNYMDKLMMQWEFKFNEVNGKESAEAAEEATKEYGKIMEVARRLIKGDRVPPSDERKLAEYDGKLYQMAKNAQMMARLREREQKEHKSLWGEEEPEKQVDAMEVADGEEALSGAPEIVSVEDTLAQTLQS